MEFGVLTRRKHFRAVSTILVVVGLAAATLLFLYSPHEQRTPTFRLPIPSEITDAQPIAGFKPPVVGDILGGMTVVSVAPFNTGQFSTAPDMMQIGPENISIVLRGPIEITGEVGPVHSAIGFDGYCMSVTDPASLARMPTLAGIPRSGFCFRHPEAVEKILGDKIQTVVVKIDTYEVESYPSEVLDWADLVLVLKK